MESRKRRLSLLLILASAIVTALTFIGAPYPDQLILQHAPTLLILLGLAVASHGRWLSGGSVLCILAFLWLHILGARWIYSFVPYDRWAEAIFGATLSEAFGWQRNHYDRLVHLASGVLLTPPASEVLQRYAGMRPKGAAIQAVAIVLALGAIYEILEWQIAVVLSPAAAEAYNGQQGDIWDPQKDLALAGLGALMTAAFLWRSSRALCPAN